MKIVLKKNLTNIKNKMLVITDKHKIKDIVGFVYKNEQKIDLKKLNYLIQNGINFSKTSKNLLYKHYFCIILKNMNTIKFIK